MSTLGFDARALWYLSRGTRMIALMLLTLALVLGVTSMTTARWTTMPRYVVAGLHRTSPCLLVASWGCTFRPLCSTATPASA